MYNFVLMLDRAGGRENKLSISAGWGGGGGSDTGRDLREKTKKKDQNVACSKQSRRYILFRSQKPFAVVEVSYWNDLKYFRRVRIDRYQSIRGLWKNSRGPIRFSSTPTPVASRLEDLIRLEVRPSRRQIRRWCVYPLAAITSVVIVYVFFFFF